MKKDSEKMLPKMLPQTAMLIVLDGWGYREDPAHNAVAQAKTPFFSALWRDYPHTLLEASGLAVGLPHGQMGNSEIGHTTIGAGKIIDTDLVRIAKAIGQTAGGSKGGSRGDGNAAADFASSDFARNSAFVKLFDHVKKHNSTLHIKGQVSDGGVHSHQDHLHAFLRAAKLAGITKIAIHAYTDGRDTGPQSGAEYFRQLERVIGETGIGFIASVTGRFYAMDRDNNWDRIKRAEDAIFEGKSERMIESSSVPSGAAPVKKPSEVLEELYAQGVKDELLEPVVFVDMSDPLFPKGRTWKIEQNDGVFFFNFRSDRARQISRKVAEKVAAMNLCFVTMTEYDKALAGDTGAEILVAFPRIDIETTLAAEVSRASLTQAHIAETEKFPHATYFLNGGQEKPHAGEEHIMIASRRDVATHDLAPKMRAKEIADKAIGEIERGTNFIFINFANPDMVGHTANVPAIVEAVEETDAQLSRVINALAKLGTDASGVPRGIAFVTADHGNAEVNVDPETKEKHTAHTINPVPAIIFSSGDRSVAQTKSPMSASASVISFDKKPIEEHIVNVKGQKLSAGLAITGTLADIAPTMLALMHIPQPKTMTGHSLLKS